MEYRTDETGDATFDVSEAGAAELDEVRHLLAKANEPYRSALPAAAFEPYLALALDLESRADVAALLVVRVGGRLAGTATFFADATAEGWGGPTGVSGLRAMAVDPSHRGQGLGTALVAECIRRTLDAGARALTLHTAEWLGDAIRLYERCGFVRDPERDRLASELMGVPTDADFVALAYRHDLGPP